MIDRTDSDILFGGKAIQNFLNEVCGSPHQYAKNKGMPVYKYKGRIYAKKSEILVWIVCVTFHSIPRLQYRFRLDKRIPIRKILPDKGRFIWPPHPVSEQ